MVGSIKIRVHAHNPSLPLTEAVSYIGSPSSVFVYDVPKKIGTWQITDVAVSVYYPDNSFATVAAKMSVEGVWVATIPACDLSGRIRNGFRILASGIDEDGEPVGGYVLGVGDLAVCKLFPAPAPDPGEKAYILRYFDTAPESPKKGDVAPIDDTIKFYDGTQWVAFGSDVDLSDYYTKEETEALFDDYYTKEETDEAIDRLAAYYITYNAAGAAFPTRAALLSASTYYSGGVVRTPTRNDYAVVLADETHDGAEYRYIYAVADGETVGQWEAQYPIETNDYTALSHKPKINNVELSGNKTAGDLGLVSQTETPLAIGGGTRTISTQSDNYVALGKDVTIRGASTVALGNSATAGGDNSLAVGPNANAQADNDLVIGGNATARATQATAIGNNSNAAGYSVAVGAGAQTGTDGTAIGFQSLTARNDSGGSYSTDGTAIGSHAEVQGNGSVAIGHNAKVTTTDAVQIGAGTNNASGSLQFRDKTIVTSEGKLNSAILDKNIPSPSLTFPEMDGEASKGTHTGYFALDDHRHPKDTSKFDSVCPTDSNKKLEWYNGTLRLKTGASSELAFPPNQYDSGEMIATQSYVRATVPDMARYALGETITASATLADRTMNKVEPLATNTADIELSFPAATNGKARDFLVLINNPTGNAGTIAFAPPGGATVYGDGLEQTFAAGETWEVTITEVATNQFLCKALKVTGKVVPWWLYFKAEEANVVVNMTKTGSPSAITLETSTDGETWTAFDAEGGTTPITLANIGDKVYFRAGQGGNTKTGGGYWSGDYHTFTLSGRAGAHGNAMSLLDGANKDNVAFTSSGGFSHLFEGCTNLTSAPDLPATTLSSDCYAAMFKSCTSLTSIPEALPATTLYEYSYKDMFSGCTSLTAGPTIMATTLARYSMWDMFEMCSLLAAVEVRLTAWSGADTQEWMEQVSSTGTFRCPAALGTNETIQRGQNYCPDGWTVVNV